jgi:deoxyadenosine/deoxycytidine kinase
MSTKEYRLPEHIRYMSIEGVIGAGKTTLCGMLGQQLNGQVVLEQAEENPFLSKFYQSRSDFAFQTQLWFLLSRHKQLSEAFMQQELFSSVTIADYIFAKDRIFAAINLDENELALYDVIAKNLTRDAIKPDYVVYLQVSTDTLLKRIQKRARPFEYNMDRNYIQTLNDAYNHFFFHYNDTPLLIINTSEVDFVADSKTFEEILSQIVLAKPGVNYYQPQVRTENYK